MKLNPSIMRLRKMDKDDIMFIFHVFVYTFGYGLVSFAYMPYLYHIGSNQYLMGLSEFLLTLSNLILPLIFIINPEIPLVKYFILYSIISTGILEFLIPHLSLIQIIILFLIIGISQFLWWYSTELFMVTYLKNSEVVNYYSFTWGISFLITPYISSFIINNYGFVNIYYLGSSVIIISSLLFLKLIKLEYSEYVEKNGDEKINIFGMLPALSSGIVLSLIYSIFSYILLNNGYTIIMLGIVFSSVSFGRIIGFFISIFIKNKRSLRLFTIFSLISMTFIFVPAFSLNFYLIITISYLLGFGSSLGISLPLIEISLEKGINSGKSIAIYELLFGIGISIFSILGGYLAENVNSKFPYMLYSFIIFITFLLYLIKKLR
ncbi:MAG: hypothetical protein ACP5LM_05660 [Thermoplasmata archaeon]